MFGWRARLGFLVPPGNPTMEPEMSALAVPGVSQHFTRMYAEGKTGSLEGQEERNRQQITHLDRDVSLLALVKPNVIVLGHTATSYTLGRQGDAELTARLQAAHGVPFVTAFACIVAALEHLGVKRVALGTPYGDEMTRQGRAHLESYGFEVVNVGRLPGVTNIYEENEERAYALARNANVDDAQAVLLSGVGLPTLGMLDRADRDFGKPVFSSAAAMMWNALRIARVNHLFDGFGRLLGGDVQLAK